MLGRAPHGLNKCRCRRLWGSLYPPSVFQRAHCHSSLLHVEIDLSECVCAPLAPAAPLPLPLPTVTLNPLVLRSVGRSLYQTALFCNTCDRPKPPRTLLHRRHIRGLLSTKEWRPRSSQKNVAGEIRTPARQLSRKRENTTSALSNASRSLAIITQPQEGW